ncbi:hypothetical protein D3C81_1077640 [compost metagenome]
MAGLGIGHQRDHGARRDQRQRQPLRGGLPHAEQADQRRRGHHAAAHAEEPRERPAHHAHSRNPARRQPRLLLGHGPAGHQAPQEVQGEADHEDCENPAQELGVHGGGQPGGEVGGQHGRETEHDGSAQFDIGPFAVLPEADHHVGRDHHQRGALGELLVHPVEQPEGRDGDQPAADAEQAPDPAEQPSKSEDEQGGQQRMVRHGESGGVRGAKRGRRASMIRGHWGIHGRRPGLPFSDPLTTPSPAQPTPAYWRAPPP